MLKNIIEGLQVLAPHFEDDAHIEFEKSFIQTGFQYEIRVVLTAEEKERMKALGWTWSTVDECWVFPAYGSTGVKAS